MAVLRLQCITFLSPVNTKEPSHCNKLHDLTHAIHKKYMS